MYRLVCSAAIYQRSYFQTNEIVYVQYVFKQVLQYYKQKIAIYLYINGWYTGDMHCASLLRMSVEWWNKHRPKFNEHISPQVKEIWIKLLTLNCDLDLESAWLHDWVMCFAHQLTKANIWPKSIENPLMIREEVGAGMGGGGGIMIL